MAISEAQLDTWAAQGKTGQFTDTYQSIRNNLLDKLAPYPVSACEVFLQGSYGNDTNVYGDSDVDIVLEHTGTFYQDLSAMSEPARAAYRAVFTGNAPYPYASFRGDALGWLQRLYNGVTPGHKAVLIPGNGNRREVDVLIAQQFRRYYDFKSLQNQSYAKGICFFVANTMIENFPKQHSENCTRKHQNTNGWFKPMVRVFKNMRNAMLKKGLLADRVAPSYFIEGMLYNVPDDQFGGTYVDTWVRCLNWIVTAERDKLLCANRLHWLVRDNTPTSWPVANFQTFIAAAKKFWEP
ncbi:MAG TPA: nucleotidyltransferase [Rhizomicrobium sp.]